MEEFTLPKARQRRFFTRLVSALIIVPFLLSAGPVPAFSAKDPIPSSEPLAREPESFVEVFSGHSWAKSWGPADIGETEESAQAPKSEETQLETGYLRPLAAGEEENPVAAGIEQELKKKSFRRGLVHGLMLALLGFGGYEISQRVPLPGRPPQKGPEVVQVGPKKLEPPAPKKEEPALKKEEPTPKKEEPALKKEEPAPKKEEPAPKKEEPAPKKEEPTPKKIVEPPPVIGEKTPVPFLQTLDPALKKRIQVWDTKTAEFFKGQKMPAPITDEMGFRVQAYHSYKSNPAHPYNKYMQERFWPYDIGVTMVYLAEKGELDEARRLGDQMMDLSQQMQNKKQKGGWRFSHGAAFTDARSMAGANAWVVHGLFDVGLHTKDKKFVERAGQLLESEIFPLQVLKAGDPREGLLLAGWGTGNEYQKEKANLPRQEVTTEHNWDFISLLRVARRAIAEVDPGSPLLKEIDRRHDLAMRMSREKLLLTPERIRAQMKRLEAEKRLTDKARAQHEKALAEIEKLPGRRRWATGMNPDGTLNVGWAFDNEVWSPHGAYDPALGYNELKNIEARFLVRLKAGQFSNLPKGVDPERVFVGLKFFTGDFEDAHVPPNPNYERLIQPEATWSYIFRLIQHGYHTADAKEREWAYGLARELIDSQLALSEIYGGSPYATLNIPDYFSTLLAIASNGHQGINLAAILRGEAPADSYLNALPHSDMTVGGKGPAWSIRRGGEPKKGKEEEVFLPGAVQVDDAFLSVSLPLAEQLAGKWAVAEVWGRSGFFLPVDEMQIGSDGLLQFHAPYDPRSEVLTGWTGPGRKRILIFDSAKSYYTSPVSLSRGGEGNSVLVVEVGEPDFDGRASAALRLAAGVEDVRRSYWKGLLAGVMVVAAGWFILNGIAPKPGPGVPDQEPPQLAKELGKELPPAKKEEGVEPPAVKKEIEPPVIKKEVEPPPVKKEVEPPPVKKEVEPPKLVLEKAEVKAAQLKVTLPPGVWARSYLKTDQWYDQEHIFQVPSSGHVVFRVLVAPPNRPGWFKANGRAVAVFTTEEAAAAAPATATDLGAIKGANAVITYTPLGVPTLALGELPAMPPVKGEEPKKIEPPKKEETPVEKQPKAGQNLMTPLKQWVEADPARELPLVVWAPAGLDGAEMADFFDLSVRKGGVTRVVVSGFAFQKMDRANQKTILTRASKAGLRTLEFIDGDIGLLKDPAFMRDRILRPLFDQLMELRPHEHKLKIAFGFDVEMHTKPGATDYPAYAKLAASARDQIRAFGAEYQKRYGVSILASPELVRYEPGVFNSDSFLKTGVDLSDTGLAGMTYRNSGDALGAAVKNFVRRSEREGKGKMPVWGGIEFQHPDIVGGPQLTFHGRVKEAPGVLLEVWKADPKINGFFLHFGSPREAYSVMRQLVGEAGAAEPKKDQPKKDQPVAGAVSVKEVKMQRTTLTLTLQGVPDGATGLLYVENRKDEEGVYYRQPTDATVFTVKGGVVTLTTKDDPRTLFQSDDKRRVRIVLVKSPASVPAFIKGLTDARPDLKNPYFFSEQMIRHVLNDAKLSAQIGLTVIEVDQAGKAVILSPSTSEESRNRWRRFSDDLDQLALALARRSGSWQGNPLLGLAPSAMKEHGVELVTFLDALKERAPAMDPFLVLVGPQAAQYGDHPSVLVTAAGAEQAAAALSLAGAGTLQYATSDPAEGRQLELALEFRGASVRVQTVPADSLARILGMILANLAGMEATTPLSRVEEFYGGVSLGGLAEVLKLLAQQGV